MMTLFLCVIFFHLFLLLSLGIFVLHTCPSTRPIFFHLSVETGVNQSRHGEMTLEGYTFALDVTKQAPKAGEGSNWLLSCKNIFFFLFFFLFIKISLILLKIGFNFKLYGHIFISLSLKKFFLNN